MLTANDGNAYVVKFANNPQSLRVLANEWLACSIGRTIGLTIPEPAILYVSPKLVENSPRLVTNAALPLTVTLKVPRSCSKGRVLASLQFFPYGHLPAIPFLARLSRKASKQPHADALAVHFGEVGNAPHEPRRVVQ